MTAASPPVTADAVPSADAPSARLWSYLLAALPALALSVAAMVVGHVVLGASLGLFFAGVFACALLVPPLAVAEWGLARPLVAAGSVAAGVAGVWLYVILRPHPEGEPYPRLEQWPACAVVAAAFAFALAGLALLLRFARVTPAVASFATMLVGLAWLTWPVWMSPWTGGRDELVAALVRPHPPLVLNGVLVGEAGMWNQRSLAYHMTNLDQDVPYLLPKSIWPAVLVHAAVGAACVGAVGLIPWARCRRRAAASPD